MACEYSKECLFFNDKMQINELLGRIHKKKILLSE